METTTKEEEKNKHKCKHVYYEIGEIVAFKGEKSDRNENIK